MNRSPNEIAPCSRLVRPFLLVLLLAFGSSSLAAQDSTTAPGRQWMVGGSLGMPGIGSQAAGWPYTTVGMHFTQVQPGAPGADIAVGIIPYGLAFGVIAVAARAGVTVPIEPGPGVLLLPSAGISLVGGAGLGGAGGATGVNLGGAAVLGTGSVGFRTGVTWHRLSDFGGSFWLLEVGFVGLPRR